MNRPCIDLLFQDKLNETLEIYRQPKDLLDRSYVVMGLKPTYKITTSSINALN